MSVAKVTDPDLKEFIEKTESGVDHKSFFKGEIDMDKKADEIGYNFKFAIGDSVKVNDKSSAYDGVTGTIVGVADSNPKFNTPVYKVDDGSGETRLLSEHKLIYCRLGNDLNSKRKNAGVDLVNHPPHYEGNIECIDAMQEVLGKEGVIHFCIGNAFKYIWRCLKKHETPVEDLKKCRWYIDKVIELIISEDD